MTKTKTAGIALAIALFGAAAVHAQDRHANVNFATGSPTGGWFPIGAKIAEMTNAEYDGQPISVVPGGGVANVLRVGSGEVELGISYGVYLAQAVEGGTELYADAMPNLRVIAALLPTVNHQLATENSGVEKISDLADADLDVATGLRGSSENYVTQLIFDQLGRSMADGGVNMMATKGRVDAWKNRQVDVVNFMLNIPASSVSDMLSARNGVWLTPDEGLSAQMKDEHGFETYTIPAGTYPGQTESVEALGYPMVVFATEDLDDEMAYRIAKTIAENPDALRSVHAGFETWKPEMSVVGAGIDFHDGAARYYREQGWLE